MDEALRSVLLDTQGLLAYGTVFAVLVACGLGLPLPEDISLILGGYLAYHGAARLSAMMVVGFTGILLGDSLIYLAGRRIGARVGQKPGFFARIVTPEKRARVEQLFAAHGQKIVMVARFLPGVRAVTYFTAGSARMPYLRFIFWDGIAALASAPVFVYLGYRFGGDIDRLIDRIKEGQVTVVGGLIAIVLGWIFWIRIRKRRIKQRALAARTPTSGSSTVAPVTGVSSVPSENAGEAAATPNVRR